MDQTQEDFPCHESALSSDIAAAVASWRSGKSKGSVDGARGRNAVSQHADLSPKFIWTARFVPLT